MSKLGIETLTKGVWAPLWHPIAALAPILSATRLGLMLSVRRRVGAAVRGEVFVAVFAGAGLALALASAVFLLIGLWGRTGDALRGSDRCISLAGRCAAGRKHPAAGAGGSTSDTAPA